MQGDLCSLCTCNCLHGQAQPWSCPSRQRGHCRGESLCRMLEMGIRTLMLFFPSSVMEFGQVLIP